MENKRQLDIVDVLYIGKGSWQLKSNSTAMGTLWRRDYTNEIGKMLVPIGIPYSTKAGAEV